MVLRNAATVLLLAGLAVGASACTAEPTAAPSSSTAATPDSPPAPTPEPAGAAATCENTVTAAYLASVAEHGFVSWTTEGASPFEEFPSGPPLGHLTCTWGADPQLGTDNVTTLAWAPIAGDAAASAQADRLEKGYERIEAAEGVYLAMHGVEGWADAEGFGQAYLFTAGDVRWAMFKDEVRFVKAPDEPAA